MAVFLVSVFEFVLPKGHAVRIDRLIRLFANATGVSHLMAYDCIRTAIKTGVISQKDTNAGVYHSFAR